MDPIVYALMSASTSSRASKARPSQSLRLDVIIPRLKQFFQNKRIEKLHSQSLTLTYNIANMEFFANSQREKYEEIRRVRNTAAEVIKAIVNNLVCRIDYCFEIRSLPPINPGNPTRLITPSLEQTYNRLVDAILGSVFDENSILYTTMKHYKRLVKRETTKLARVEAYERQLKELRGKLDLVNEKLKHLAVVRADRERKSAIKKQVRFAPR